MADFKEMFADLLDLEDPMDKYEWIIDYGAGTVGLFDKFHTDENLVRGCTSLLWVAKIDDRLWAWGESSIVNGLACMICDWYNRASDQERAELSVNTLADVGLMPILSMGRQNGVANLIARIKSL